MIKGRGRWASDVFEIYTRADMDVSVEASARAVDVSRREVESIFRDWAEPAR